jgi:predicted HTH transcriptional regulator
MKIEREEFIEVTNELVQILLTTSEKEDLDFKRVGKVRNVFKTAVAMANGKGGLIVLGIGDSKDGNGEERLFGIEENLEGIGEIKRGFNEEIVPALAYPDVPDLHFLPLKVKKQMIQL